MLGLAFITVFTRGFFLFPERELPIPDWLQQSLRYAPLAALVAVVAPEIVLTQGQLIGTWKVLGNIGICSMKLKRDGEAIEAFEKYLQEGGAQIDKEEKAQVERDLSMLKASVVTVKLAFPSSPAKMLDERQQ